MSFIKTIVLGLDSTNFEDSITSSAKKTDEFKNSLDEASESSDDFGKITENLGLDFTKLASNIATSVLSFSALKKGLSFLKDQTMELASTADTLKTTSETTRMSVETIQQLQYATSQLNTDFSTVESSITKLTQSMDKARDGIDRQAKAFAALGVSYKDSNGQLKDTTTVFFNTIDALSKVQNETERAAYAMDIFGTKSKDLQPLLSAGSKEISELMKRAQEMGYVIGGETIESAANFNDSMEELKIKVEKLKEQLGVFLLPVLQKVVDFLINIPPSAYEVIAVIGAAVAILTVITGAIKAYQAATTLAAAANAAFGISGATAASGLTVLLVVLLAIAAAAAVIGGISFAADKITGDASKAANNAMSEAKRISYNASGTSFFGGGETWVGENGPERVVLPRGSKIYPNDDSQGRVTNVYNVTIDAKNVKDFNDVVRLAQREQASYRVGVVNV